MKSKYIHSNDDTDQNLKSALIKILLDLNVELPENESTLKELLHNVQNTPKPKLSNNIKQEQAENPDNKE